MDDSPTSPAAATRSGPEAAALRVAVLDMQPIEPAVGGGRLRLLGLYHGLGAGIAATYVGTYDWPGPGFRDHALTPSLREIDIPLSTAHFAAAAGLRERVRGKPVIDVAFAEQAHLTPQFVAATRRQVAASDVVVFSHPWVHPLVWDAIDPARQLIVYDAHNVEGLLRTRLLDDGGGEGTRLAREVVRQEHRLARAADLVLACSHEDRLLFERLYGVSAARIRVVPNGVFVRAVQPADARARREARQALGLAPRMGTIALFLGSAYAPNREAAELIANELAPAFPQVRFMIAGGVGDGLEGRGAGLPANLQLTGQVDEADKLRWLAAADIALNPMLSGSGTNIKMFDFMAAGLPVLTTPVGARGIEVGAEPAFAVHEPGGLAAGLRALLDDAARREALASRARRQVERHFAWERISADLGRLLRRQLAAKRRGRPYYSVVIPSYERPDKLARAVQCLARQDEASFEVIVVDQSPAPWGERERAWGIDLEYVHTDVRGAVHARNLGALLACGEVIAFTDDDCEPSPGWLAAARPLLRDPGVAGVEGMIRCDAVSGPEWRTVTNEGWRGMGFMTANLFVRVAVFNHIGGFDPVFDEPHFREDTDLGWRARAIGRMPFSEAAWVYHPPQPRALESESSAARDRFFVKDALLYRKHPQSFVELIQREGHIHGNPSYLRYLFEGFRRYGVVPGPDLLRLIPRERLQELLRHHG